MNQARRKSCEADILKSVARLLADNEKERDKIRRKLKDGGNVKNNLLRFDLLDSGRIFHISHIKKVCIDYRLRFLDTALFRHEFPEEAVTQIREIEKNHDTALGGFRIVAPTKAFHLLNYNDPLLFVPIGGDYYYLVHQWGDDLKAFQLL